MYSANGDFINNQSIIENFKNNKENAKNKPVPNVSFTINALQNDKPINITSNVPINRVPDSIDMFKFFLNDINKINQINISFKIKNDRNFRTFEVKTSKETEVTFVYQYNQNNINYGYATTIKNEDFKVNRFNYIVDLFDLFKVVPPSIIIKCKITIKPDIDSNVIIMNDLKTAINDIIV
jgi:hypothetical protein